MSGQVSRGSAGEYQADERAGKEAERQLGGLSKNENAHQLICELQKAPYSSFLKVCTKKQEVNSVRGCFLCQK